MSREPEEFFGTRGQMQKNWSIEPRSSSSHPLISRVMEVAPLELLRETPAGRPFAMFSSSRLRVLQHLEESVVNKERLLTGRNRDGAEPSAKGVTACHKHSMCSVFLLCRSLASSTIIMMCRFTYSTYPIVL